MALKNLSTATMLALSSQWLDPKRGRKALEAHPRASAYVPDLEAVSHALLATESAPEAGGSTKLAQLTEEGVQLDQRHDRKARGLNLVLTGLAELSDDPDEARGYLELRDLLLPEGVAVTQRSYRDEAGNTQIVEARLEQLPAARALLHAIPLPHGRTLDAAAVHWFETGRDLGKLEARRDVLLHERDASKATQPRVNPIDARNRWGRVTRALLAALDLDDSPDEALARHVVGPLRRAEAQADRRQSGHPAEDDHEQAPADPTPA